MVKVIIEDKKTGERKVLSTFKTMEAAEKECEEWGWSYDDGEKSYWMSINEEESLGKILGRVFMGGA